MSTHSSRNTTTGQAFENYIHAPAEGNDISQYKFAKYFKSKKIDTTKILSKMLRPDEAYIDEVNKTLTIFEKKYQEVPGSADEKPQTCAFKILQYKKLGEALGIEKVSYTYIFSEWFRRPEYKGMLDYIKTVPGCDYFFASELKENGSK